jgi:ABC-2 type transport system permease protein
MQAYCTLVRRELGSYFASLTGYVIISAVLFLIGFSFADLLERLNREATDVPVTELFYQTWYFWLILLLASPLVTMRSFAQEKSAGTFETLVTAPVSDGQVVLAKFTSALVFHLLMWSPLLACILIVRHYTNDTSAFSPGVVASTYLGISLIGSLYMAIGCFASALTRSQIIAAILSFVVGVVLFLMSFRSLFNLPQTGRWADIFTYLSLMEPCASMIEHMQDFVRGTWDTRYLVFYVSLTAFFLFLTLKVVEGRRWK